MSSLDNKSAVSHVLILTCAPGRSPIFSVVFWWYKSVAINIFVFFQNKILKSKYRWLFLETYVEKFHNCFWFFHWNSYLKTDSSNLLILISVNDFHKKICRNFFVIFLQNVLSNNERIVLGKNTKCRKSKTMISPLRNRPKVMCSPMSEMKSNTNQVREVVFPLHLLSWKLL